jgi:hypothetical protein
MSSHDVVDSVLTHDYDCWRKCLFRTAALFIIRATAILKAFLQILEAKRMLLVAAAVVVAMVAAII